jgi:hypothetical protein
MRPRRWAKAWTWLGWGAIAAVGILLTVWSTRGRGDTAEVPGPAPAARGEAPTFESTDTDIERVRQEPWSGEVVGQVVDLPYSRLALLGGPAAGANVELWSGWEKVGSTLADSDGGFRFKDADKLDPNQRIDLRVREDSHYRDVVYHTTIERFRMTEPVTIERPAHGILDGRVVDQEGRPVSALHIEFTVTRAPEERLEVVTDSDGRFEAAGLRIIDLALPGVQGVSLVNRSTPSELAAGGWEEMSITVERAATMALHVEEWNGSPAVGARVALVLGREELVGEAAAGGKRTTWKTTDSTGQCAASVPASRHMRLAVIYDGRSYGVLEATEQSVSMRQGQLTDVPVVVPPQGSALTVVLPMPFAIEGLVVYRDGTAASKPEIRARRIDEEQGEDVAVTRGNESGRFTILLSEGMVSGPLRLVATDPKRIGVSPRSPAFSIGEQVTSVSREAPVANVEITLRDPLTISGILVDSEGDPVTSPNDWVSRSVQAVPAGAVDPETKNTLGLVCSTKAAPDGTFCVSGLDDQLYDLMVSSQTYSHNVGWPASLQRFTGIPAGSTGVRLVLEDKNVVSIGLEIEGVDLRQVAELYVSNNRMFGPRDPTPSDRVGRRADVNGIADWPLGAAFRTWGGGARVRSGPFVGRRVCMRMKSEDEDLACVIQIPMQGEGWIQVGVECYDENGRPLMYPMASPVWFYPAGEHVLHFHAIPVSRIEGHIRGATESPMAVSLCDTAGRRIALHLPASDFDLGSTVTDAMPLIGGNRFVMDPAPSGRLVLWLGSHGELANESPRYTKEIQIAPGVTENIEWRVP